MKGHSYWHYHPYSRLNDMQRRVFPFLCRLAPHENSIEFEWFDNGDSGPHTVFCRIWGSDRPYIVKSLSGPCGVIDGLETGRDYELFISREDGGEKSPVRRFRTGASVGTIVNYLHPADEVYSFSGWSLCSPSLVKLPSGTLLASMDVFAGKSPQNLSLLFSSEDDGITWRYVNDLFPCFWGKLFVHRNILYMLAHTTEYGSLMIGQSTDEGRTWSAPVTILPGSGFNDQGPHKGPMPVIGHEGRLYTAVDYGSWAFGGFGNALLSIDAGADLMEAENWVCSEFLPYDPQWPGAAGEPCRGGLEGNAVAGPDGEIYNVLRYQMMGSRPSYGKALVLKGNKADPEAPLSFAWFADFNGGSNSKYDLLYDRKSNAYWAIVSEIVQEEHPGQRNVLSLAVSKDLRTFSIAKRLLDYRQEDPAYVGFQYVSFLIDGDDILYLCRTSINHGRNMHDANYSTFHRIENFRQYLVG